MRGFPEAFSCWWWVLPRQRWNLYSVEKNKPTWCGEMTKSIKWPAKMQQHLQYYNSTNHQPHHIVMYSPYTSVCDVADNKMCRINKINKNNNSRGAMGQVMKITGLCTKQWWELLYCATSSYFCWWLFCLVHSDSHHVSQFSSCLIQAC